MCTKIIFIVTFILTFSSYSSFGKNLPSFIRKCKYSTDKNELGKCIQEVGIEIYDHFLNGFEEFQLPPLDPLKVDDFSFDAGANNSALTFLTRFTNLTVEGSRHMVLNQMTLDIEHPEITSKTFYPYWNVQSEYEVKGNILILPLNSFGHAKMNYTSIEMKDIYKGRRYSKQGKEYIKWLEGNVDAKIKGGKMYLGNLINGNPQLTKTANDILNDNLPTLLPEITYLFAQPIVKARLKLLNIIFDHYSLDELFIMDQH